MKKTSLILIACLILSALGQSQEPISDADYKALLEKSKTVVIFFILKVIYG